MSLFDVYTVSIIPSIFGLLTVMSAPPFHHRGARPKTTGPPSNITYACIACQFSDFKTAHSLRRHLIRVHNLAGDTLVQGRPFPHVGYVMRRPNARELHDFPRLVFPYGWAVNHRQDVDPEVVSHRPPFGHRFVGIWLDIQCVPITNSDGSDNLFGRNRSITVDTVALRQVDRNINRHLKMIKTQKIGKKRQRESPGFDTNRKYREWIASQGDVASDRGTIQCATHRRVTFDDETFEDSEEIVPPGPALAEAVNNEWGVDGDDHPHPSTEHRERITWRLAPSKRHINLNEGHFRESYDLDLLAFQAGSYASDEEETTYLNADIDSRLIKGVQLATPEEGDDLTEPTEDMPGQAHATPTVDAKDLANEPEEINAIPLAAIDTSEDNIVVESAPEIDCEFGIDISSH